MPLAIEPGKGHTYNTAVSHLLAVVIARQAKTSLLEFARKRLFTPLGMRVRRWDTDAKGYCEGGSELHLTARDMARFGFLYLNAGQWEGKEIVPAGWVWESLRPHAAQDPLQANYGYQWWIGQDDERPSFIAFGYGGQTIQIVPTLDLVIVMTSTTIDPSNNIALLILEHILPAVNDARSLARPAK